MAKRRGPKNVAVEEFLIQNLSNLTEMPDRVKQNRRLNEFILLSLCSKKLVQGSHPLRQFLSSLDKLTEYDLELCASILGGDMLELPCGTYYPLTRIEL